jgi:hypothetical protein
MKRDAANDQRELVAKRELAMQPKVEQVGNTLGMFDPGSMSYNPIYQAPQPFEAYASSLGLVPGTDEYHQAIKDYRAGTWNDQGVEGRLTVQQPRLDVTARGQDLSHGDRVRGQDLTHGDRVRGQDLSHGDRVRGQNLGHTDRQASIAQSDTNSARSAETTRGSYGYQHGGGKHPTLGNEPVAVGPKGQKIVVRGGRWVDAATGKPVQ